MKKKILPVLAVLLLVIIVAGIGVISKIIEKYTPSDQYMESQTYFGLSSEEDLAIVIGGEVKELKGKLIDGVAYIAHDTVKECLNERFYWDSSENVMVYTTPTDLIKAETGSSNYTVGNTQNFESYVIIKADGNTAYIALDFVQKYTKMEYKLHTEPNRVVIENEFGTVNTITVKNSDFVRYQGGIKSDILTEVKKGQTLTVLQYEELDEWAQVQTEDGYIGYIQKSKLNSVKEQSNEYTGTYVEPTYTSLKKNYTINMVWHNVTNQDANNNLLTDLENVKGVNTIAPTWFYLTNNNGDISTALADNTYVDRAKSNGLEVWGTVDCFTYAERTDMTETVDITKVLSSTSNRERLTTNLITAAMGYNLEGINIDFEAVPTEAGEAYIQFIRELSIKCRKNNIVLSIDNPVPMSYNAHYNMTEQGIVADYVIIMSYDEYYVKSDGESEIGPVASMPFVVNSIETTLAQVPADKVINAVPFYTRIWKETTNDAGMTEIGADDYGMNSSRKFFDQYEDSVINWSDEYQQSYAEVQLEGIKYQAWLEDTESIDKKAALIKEYDLAGIAAWRLGLEDSSVWDIIYKYTN